MKKFSIEYLRQKTSNIKGALSENEGKFLYMAAKYGKGFGEIVEIGSFQGRSTVFLASGSKSSGREKITAIDPHTGGNILSAEYSPPTYSFIVKNLKAAGVSDYVRIIRNYSWNAVASWNKSIRLLFIDGNHEFKAVERDILDWEPFLGTPGIIAFHDVLNPEPGPSKAIFNLLKRSSQYSDAGFVDSIFFLLKQKSAPIKHFRVKFFYGGIILCIMSILNMAKKINVPKVQRFLQQYIVKRWLKKILSRISKRAFE